MGEDALAIGLEPEGEVVAVGLPGHPVGVVVRHGDRDGRHLGAGVWQPGTTPAPPSAASSETALADARSGSSRSTPRSNR